MSRAGRCGEQRVCQQQENGRGHFIGRRRSQRFPFLRAEAILSVMTVLTAPTHGFAARFSERDPESRAEGTRLVTLVSLR